MENFRLARARLLREFHFLFFFFSFLFFVFCFGLFLFRYMTLAAILFIFCAINATRPRRGDSNFEGKKTHPLFVSFLFFFFLIPRDKSH